MTEVIKVFTPIKRVPTLIGKAQNGQRLPFGPYTLPQIAGGVVIMVISSVCAMSFPINPAITFVTGLIVTGFSVFVLGLVPYTGVRLLSRALWMGRLLVIRKPVSASGMPADADGPTLFVDETVVIMLSDRETAERPRVELLSATSPSGPEDISDDVRT
ncbi:hypothetical protein [Nocardia sp. NPDC050793]|uniref:hypothetical protein n=1 Tax=Nocardia sp. NPDC050793 TaxID=3155159 RepID=UPI0033DE690D